MKIIITKTVFNLANGDKEVVRERRIIADLEKERVTARKNKLNCLFVEFEYENIPE